ncbi:MAG: hypothetical protein PVF17_00810 [Ignavibacteria bacterium]|jgi:hypothetical protein
MGQRLNIEICNNKKTLANCYYHWGGYTLSSLELTEKIINYFNENKVLPNEKGAIELLEATGASYPGKDRSAGLIDVDPKKMEQTRKWEEGRITINIEKNTFDFKCAFEKDYIDDEEIWNIIQHKFYKIHLDTNFQCEIQFSKIEDFIKGVEIAQNKYGGRFQFGFHCYISIF